MTSHNKRVRVAVIGLGDMGLKHAAVYRGLDNVEVAAIVDTRADALAEHAPKLGVPASAAFTSVEALIEAASDGRLVLDAVDVCVPNAFHAAASIAALEIGLDVLCEKPVANTLEGARRIAAAADASRGHIMFGFLYRYHPDVMAWKDEVARDLGKLISAHVSVMRRDGIPGRSAFLDRALTGGGPGVDLLPHALAVVADVTGMLRPSTVVGLVHPPQAPGANTVEDAAYGTFVFEDGGDWVVPGAQLTVATSWRANLPAGDPDERWTIRLIGTEGGFEIVLPTGPVAAQAGYDAEIGLYVARVRGAVAWSEDEIAHGLLVQEQVEGLYESAASGGLQLRLG